MSVVNSILNLVDLNATKYNQKLKGVTKTTQAESKKTASAFSAMSSAWTAAVSVISSAALGTAVVKELKATESAVASFIGATGGVTEARAMFEMLQQSARDTVQPFDALKAAALDLRRNGIEPNAEQLKTFSQIAISSGKSLETVTASFTAVLQGRYKALNQLGITAKDAGDKLTLTYKGQTTQIEKNTAALSAYFDEIGAQNAEALEYLQGGMSGAFNHLDNAWGDFIRAIGETGLGDVIAEMVRKASRALDSITGWINQNRPYFKEFFAELSKSFNTIADVIGGACQDGLDAIIKFWDDSEDEAKTGVSNIGFFLSQFFKFARVGFMENVAKPASTAWSSISGGLTAIGEGLGTSLSGGNFFDAYNNSLNRNADEMIETAKHWDQAIKFQLQEIDDARTRLENETKNPPAEPDKPKKTAGFTFGGFKGGNGSGAKAAQDTWGAYYSRVIQMQEDSASERAKIEADYFAKLAELQEESAKSNTATAEQVALARQIIEEEHTAKLAELQARAHDFYVETIGDEETQIRESYARKLEELQAFNEQQLLSEAQFLEARAALYEQYTADLTTLKKKQRGDADAFFTKEQREELQAFSDGTNTLADAFSNLTATMSQSGATYKTMFALQKAFAVASATTNAILAWSKALGESEGGWMQALANYASAVAMTTNILTQLKGVTMHDHGGNIPAGRVGIVGEFGPELVTGPANVTSRRETADLARQAMGGTNVQVNLYEDASKAGSVEDREGPDGEQIINIFVSNIRRGGQMAQTLENTYQLHRYGA